MKRLLNSVLILLFLFVSFNSLAYPQKLNQGSGKSAVKENLLGLSSESKSFSLLDPSRFKMWHSYTFSYVSGRSGSGNIGLYMNTIEYRPSDPLRLQVSLGYLHQPFSVIGGQSSGGRVLPNFQLWYNPNDKFHLYININTTSLWHDRYFYDNLWNRRR